MQGKASVFRKILIEELSAFVELGVEVYVSDDVERNFLCK